MTFEDNEVEDIVVRGYFVKDIVAEDSGSIFDTKLQSLSLRTVLGAYIWNIEHLARTFTIAVVLILFKSTTITNFFLKIKLYRRHLSIAYAYICLLFYAKDLVYQWIP